MRKDKASNSGLSGALRGPEMTFSIPRIRCPPSGRENPPLLILSSCGWTNNKIDTGRTNRRKKKQISTRAHGGLIEMEPKKWAKQAAFIFFRQRNGKFVRN